ncbi:MAG: RNA pyrophosphohydrolase [Alphaproteobacteria bacterium]
MSYRINVGMMLVNPERKIFVGQRIDKITPAWQMPQGGVDFGEPYQAAACRELIEEIGTDAFEFWHESQHWRTYDFPQKASNQSNQPWDLAHKGQKQRWFLFRFTGNDKDICLETEHPEFSAWKWSTPEALIQEIVSFKRDVYKGVLEEFLPIFSTP